MRREKWRIAVFYYIFLPKLDWRAKILFYYTPLHWCLAAFSFHRIKRYWRAADLDQGINLEWPNGDYKSYIMNP